MNDWRDNREVRWYNDIGYKMQDVVRSHRYDTTRRGSKPDDPGWHACSCGWEGYWCDFEPHVADMLREIVVAYEAEAQAEQDSQNWVQDELHQAAEEWRAIPDSQKRHFPMPKKISPTDWKEEAGHGNG